MLTIEEYEAKRNARYERLLRAAEKAHTESEAALNASRRMSDYIPVGQPILIGHCSEGRDRRFRERIRKKASRGFELAKKAEELRNRAASVEQNESIYSDNPEAINLLTRKINELKDEQAEMKRINAALRKGADFDALEMSDKHRNELLSVEKYQAYYEPRKKGFPPYALTNINAKIKAAEKRAELVQEKQSAPDNNEEVNGVRIEWRPAENRIRLFYPARVPPETFNLLKQHGFRALRSEGFSAYYNNNAMYFVKTYLKQETESK